MRLIATTVVRESAKGRQTTGWIYDVDWDSGTFVRMAVPDPTFLDSDDNPRGGVRGGRGVAVTNHGIVVANYDTLHLYDDAWNEVAALSHPLMVGMHEVDWDGEHLWLTATAIDAVLRLTLDGHAEVAWDPHVGEAARLLGLRSRRAPLDASVDYRQREAPRLDRCHINEVRVRDGGLVVNCGLVKPEPSPAARGAAKLRGVLPGGGAEAEQAAASFVIAVDPDGSPRVLSELGGHDLPTHNGRLLDEERVVVNDSTQNTLRVLRVEDGEELCSVRVGGRWLRGLETLDGRHAVVGTAPAALVLVDLESGAIEREVTLSDDPNEAVHGLTGCPPPETRR